MSSQLETNHVMPSLSILRSRLAEYLAQHLEGHRQSTPTCSQLHSAMQYSLLTNSGQRWRPLLTYLVASAYGATLAAADPAAAAIECIHTYSLIHDDLPAMDDDDYRRQQPSCHRAFDEATAILAGDCLSNMAFEILCQPHTELCPAQQLAMLQCLTQASGASGMAYGQALDLTSNNTNLNPSTHKQTILQIHHFKTGCLFAASAKLGALAANLTNPQQLTSIFNFGLQLGIAYQVQDDLDDYKLDKNPNIVSATGYKYACELLAQLKLQLQTQLADSPISKQAALQELISKILPNQLANTKKAT